MAGHEESLQIPRSNGNCAGAGVDFNAANFINADITQASFEPGGIPEVPSSPSSSLIASGGTVWTSLVAGVPRSYPPVELLRLPSNRVHTEEVQEVEPTSYTHSRPLIPGIVVRDRPRRDPKEWEKWKPEIINLYQEEGRPLPVVATEMAEKGFSATEPMYKRKFKKWGLRKNQNIKKYGKPEQKLVPISSLCSVVPVRSPTHVRLGVPTPMGENELDGFMRSILSHVKNLYMSSMDQGNWKIMNPYEVQEDIHDDLLVGVANALRSFNSLGPKFLGMGMNKAFKTLEKVVADCGLFSLPTIWESYLRMRRQGHQELAMMFLSQAVQFSNIKFRYEYNHNQFVQALVGLRKIEKHYPHMLEQVIFRAYRICIDLVTNKLSSLHLTTLSLWGDFVVYVDSSSANEIKKAVDNFRLAKQRSEEDNGSDDDYTLEILGLTLYVMQSNKSMAEEAEQVALDMLGRVNRRVNAGETLEGNLLILWKDLRHTLGTFYHARGDLNNAVIYLEECLSHEVADDRDTFALECLELWYAQLGRLDDAQRIRQRRISSSQILLQDNVELAECGGVDKEGEEGNGDEGTDEGTDEDTDEDTYENDGSNGQTIEDDDAAEIEDAEVELQILQGEMENLQRRMTILEKKVEKNKGKQTASSVE